MTSSSSLYGSVTQQNVSSTNSTSLYGEAGTPIPDASGNVVVRGDLIVLSGNILTTATTGNVFPTNATTVNLGLAATTVSIGAATGSTTINNTLFAPGADFGNITIAVADDQTITTNAGELRLGSTSGAVKLAGIDSLYTDTTGTFNLLNQPLSVFAFRNATQLELGEDTGTTGINNNLRVDGTIAAAGTVTAPGADFGNITIGVADDQTITTTAGELRLSSTSTAIKLPSVTSIYTDTSTFGLLNQPTTVGAFLSATSLNLGAATGTTNINNDLLVDGDVNVAGGDLTIGGNGYIYSSTGLAIDVTGADTRIVNDLTISGDQVNLAPATNILYNENNDRLNRPQVQSTTGNTSGFRVMAPNATTSAQSNLSVFATNDIDNGEFLSFRASGSTTAPFSIRTGKYTAGVVGAAGEEINFVDNTTVYASVNPAGPTNALDLTTKGYVDAIVIDNTTYTIDATATTGGANLNLVGTDLTTDTVKFAGGTNVTVTRTDANTITIDAPVGPNTTYTIDATATTGGANLNLVGSDLSTDTVAYLGSGATTVTRTDANTVTISSTDTNTTYTQNISSTTGGANLNLVGSDSTTDTVKFADGTGVTVSYTDASTATVAIGQPVATTDNVTFNSVDANITDDNYVLGQLIATRNTAYVPPVSALTTIAGQNGIVVASSSGGAGYGANIAIRYHSGDTTAGNNNSSGLAMSGASGTSTAPGGVSTNQVMGSLNYDGYTAGTSNNYASQIATTNQGAGTAGINPIQMQFYARQAFLNSVVLSTAVTGASGTGSVATLTFTTQNTAPYVVGQTVTIAGMTPSGYNNAAAIITVATTSSISYANTTTGFTSGGTIAAANTVTAAGTGYRIRGYANSTNLTPGNRFNLVDHTATAATFKTDTYTFANSVITGSTLTATNYLALNSTGSTFATSAGTYASMTAVSNTYNITGRFNINRTTSGTGLLLTYKTATANPVDGDMQDFRLGVTGTVTGSDFARFDGTYKSSGDNEIGLSVSSDSFVADTDRIYVGSRASTQIRNTPAGGGTTSTTAEFTQLATTLRTDSVVLQTAAGPALPSGKISYGRQYINAYDTTDQTNPVANAENLMKFGTTDISSGISIVSNGTALTRITFANAGVYNLQFSAQLSQTAGGADNAFIWLKKNGTTVANTAGDTRVAGNGDRIMAAWNYVFSAAAGDYYELAWAASGTTVILEAVPAAGVVPGIASVILTVVPVGA